MINNFGKVVYFYRYSGKYYEINDANLLSLIEEEKKKKAEKAAKMGRQSDFETH